MGWGLGAGKGFSDVYQCCSARVGGPGPSGREVLLSTGLSRSPAQHHQVVP